jgi:hypothetical protein
MMISTRAQATRRTSPHARRGDAGIEVLHDPASLSAALRELAVRSHRAVRAAEVLRSRPSALADLPVDSDRELSDLLVRIVQLQQSLHTQSLSGLAPYVAALRQKVEAQLLCSG